MALLGWITAAARSRVKQHRFDRLLERTVGRAAGWTSEAEVLAEVHRGLRTVIDAAPVPLRKGSPDLVALKAADARRLVAMMPALRSDGERALRLAGDIASVDPRDEAAFALYLAVFWFVHAPVIAALKALRAEHLVLHMSCRPRLARAMESVASFDGLAAPRLAHVTLVGHGGEGFYRFDGRVLEVPAGDGYDQLPAKMASALALLAIACDPRCVIKLDDDHRVGDGAALMRLLERCARVRRPLQAGHLYFTPYPSGHNRGWHLGKCPGRPIDARPLAFPTPNCWASGEYGYLLNRAALRRMPWAALYWRDWLAAITYEDIAMGEIGARLGIDLRQAPLERAVSALHAY